MEPDKHRPSRGYETRDATLRAVGLLVTLTVGLTLVALISMWLLFGFVVRREAAQDAAPSPLAGTRTPFVGPRLQVSPPKDMKEMRAAEQEILQSYGWVERDRGIVRIPIERAMDLIATKGLPARSTVKAGEEER